MRRMLTIDELFESDPTYKPIRDVGVVASTDLLSTKIAAGQSGIYHYYDTVLSRSSLLIINFSYNGLTVSGLTVSAGFIDFFRDVPFSTASFTSITQYLISDAIIPFYSATSINANLGGTPTYGLENSTLHIKGTFTPTATIAAGTKLFSTGQSLSAKATLSSAINTGSTGAETFIGISIQTNGDVYCLGALTAGVTYNIAVAATL